MRSQVDGKDRLSRLKDLRDVLESAIFECESKRDLAALARQYRETIKEIEELEGADAVDDGITEILAAREANGNTTAFRKNRTAV